MAIANYEKWHNMSFGTDWDKQTCIDTITKTSLGIEGWALFNFGNEVDIHEKIPPPASGEGAKGPTRSGVPMRSRRKSFKPVAMRPGRFPSTQLRMGGNPKRIGQTTHP